ncbi:MAG: glycosyltransferase family 1 protein [Sphingomonadaceae bacterium]|nr:glycosyltransferase family 1 protein [Sphingomonadaceae bacterium]
MPISPTCADDAAEVAARALPHQSHNGDVPIVSPDPRGCRPVRQDQLRVALFSGNYNYIQDGANRTLNRLVGYLERQGVAVRVYSPTSKTPAFPPTGTLISVPSFKFPGRGDYRVAWALNGAARRDLEAFAPNLIHLSAPDRVAFLAKRWGRARGIPVVASVHTRFDTYFSYYNLGFVTRTVAQVMRNLYQDLPEIYAPSESMAEQLRADRMSTAVKIWSRGVDPAVFNPGCRSLAWRQAHGIADDERVIAFVGRLVIEKGLDVFADTVDRLTAQGVGHRVLIVGDGPARAWAAARMPQAIFTGHLADAELAIAYASADLLFNPSTTETFGNVTLEAMASGLPVVGARATGTSNLVHHGISGLLVAPGDIAGYADALTTYLTDPRAAAMAGDAGLTLSRRYDADEINGAMLERYRALVAAPTLVPQSAWQPIVDKVATALRAA